MIRFLKKKIKNSIVLIAVLLLVFSSVAYAAPGEPDPSILGSIKSTLRESGTGNPITTGSVTLYKVADMVKNTVTHQWEYVLTSDFSGSGATIVTLPDVALAASLATYAGQNAITGTVKNVDSTGTVTYDNLQIGLYLLVHTTASTGYQSFAPFFVSVPLYQSDTYIYDVDASPKMAMLTPNPPPPPIPTPVPTPPPTTPPKKIDGDGTRIPQTGQLNWPIPLLAGTGLLLFFGGWYLFTSEESQKHE